LFKQGLNHPDSHFDDYQHFINTIDEIDYDLPWTSATLNVPPALKKENSGWNSPLTFHYRNALECIQSLFGQPSLLEHMEYGPKRIFDGQGNRIYTDLSSSNWWWETQEKLPDGALVLPVILGSDATQLSVLSGTAKAWPVYISIGNIPKDIRYIGRQQSLMLLGYLPIPHCKSLAPIKHFGTDSVTEILGGEKEASDPLYLEWKRSVFHQALRVMIEPLFQPAREGILLPGPDTLLRNCFPILSVYIADYPEQVLLTLIKYGSCPKCKVPSNIIANDLSIYPPHSQHSNNVLRQTLSAQDLWAQHQLINIIPFTTSWPYSDIHVAISPDILHQIFKGVFKHVMTWVGDHIRVKYKMTIKAAQAELDRRFQQMLPWPGLKPFNKGISAVKTWQGHEQRDMMRVYLGVINGLVDDEIMWAVRFLIQFIMVAEYKSHSDATLRYMEKYLKGFYDRKSLLVPDKEDWKIPKLHAITHYITEIRSKGATDGYTSNHTERAHKLECKIPYSQTNKHDPDRQMVKHIDRLGKLIHKARYLDYLAKQEHVVEEGNVKNIGSRLVSTPIVGSTSNAAQERLHCEFPLLKDQIRTYLQVLDNHQIQPQNACRTFDSTVTRYPSLRCAYYRMHDYSGKSGVISNLVRCTRKNRGFVLVLTKENGARSHGMDDKLVAQLRLLFTVKRNNETIPLALVDWFKTCGSNPDVHNGMYKIKRKMLSTGRQDSDVINVTAILCGVHLVPKFPIHTVERKVSEVIEDTTYFFVNNYIDEHMYHSMY
jgi:hypothetical protein